MFLRKGKREVLRIQNEKSRKGNVNYSSEIRKANKMAKQTPYSTWKARATITIIRRQERTILNTAQRIVKTLLWNLQLSCSSYMCFAQNSSCFLPQPGEGMSGIALRSIVKYT